jgi:uncharacterized SAM-binding protein YcdF (DUF218 family)
MFGRLIRGTLQAIGFFTVLAFGAGLAAFVFLASWLQYQDQPERARYIVPLAGNDLRLIKAAELYKQGFAPKILLGNEQIRPLNRAETLRMELGHPKIDEDQYRFELLAHFGVPRNATETFGRSLVSTAEEAEALKQYLGDPAGTIILVTSPSQARRAKMIFERTMPQVRWLIVWPPERILPARWWADRDAALDAVMEVAKLVYYWTGGVFRSGGAETQRLLGASGCKWNGRGCGSVLHPQAAGADEADKAEPSTPQRLQR